MTVDINKLKVNPYHSKIYETSKLKDLVDSIRDKGQLVPIAVNSKFVIISGVRRFLALQQLNVKEVNVEIINVEEKDELELLISFNKQRVKTASEEIREVHFLTEIWGQKRGRKVNDGKNENDESTEKVDTRKKISEEIGVSTGTISKLLYIHKQKPELIAAIDKGDLSVNQAHNALKKVENQKKAITFQTALPQNITAGNFKIYNKSSDDLSDLEDESIQTIFTSPPYWNKRKYSNSTEELGAEKTSEDYVQRVANHLHQCHRVLKNTGSFFLNIGETFHNKCQLLIPHRVACELIKKGWILRNTIIWKKTNPLPSSVKDNLSPSYEYIFHLVKSDSYYYNQILVPAKETTKLVTCINQKGKNGSSTIPSVCINGLKSGKNIEDFWTLDIVTTATANQATVRKYGGKDHPAPFPADIVSLPILQTSKPGDVVMDVFSGSGTVGEVALLLGRKYVGYELNPNFNKVQNARLTDAVNIYNNASALKIAA